MAILWKFGGWVLLFTKITINQPEIKTSRDEKHNTNYGTNLWAALPSD